MDPERNDPLHLDGWFTHGPTLVERPVWASVRELERIVDDPAPGDADGALAALRDLDMLLCLVQRAAPGKWPSIPGLENLLLTLGKTADHIPRGCNHTYGVINPPRALRTFTGLPAERELIEALRAGGVGLGDVLAKLCVLATTSDAYAATEAARGLAGAWDPMVASAVRMARVMPLDVFSRDIIPWLVPLTIGGVVYRAPTGAQFSNTLIDWVLWGVAVAREDEVYREYAAAFMAETPRSHRQLVDATLTATGGRALLDVLPERLARTHPNTARTILDGVDGLLRRIRDFRAVHQRFAIETLQMRAADVGSGMQAETQFTPLLAYTRRARARLHAERERVTS